MLQVTVRLYGDLARFIRDGRDEVPRGLAEPTSRAAARQVFPPLLSTNE